MFLAACCIARLEHPYIAEWIDHHRAVGVERFVVYEDARPGEPPLAPVLAPWVAEGAVEIRPAPVGPRRQYEAYDDCLRLDGGRCEWIAFLDVDEFLVPTAAPDLHAYLADLDGAGGLAVHWLVFGSNGHRTKPAGTVAESYVRRSRRSFKANRLVKSIVRPRDVLGADSGHRFVHREGRPLVNELGEEVRHRAAPHTSRTIQLNHYWSKSHEEFFAKARRGDVADKDFLRRHVGRFETREALLAFYERSCNAVEDRAILRLREAARRST